MISTLRTRRRGSPINPAEVGVKEKRVPVRAKTRELTTTGARKRPFRLVDCRQPTTQEGRGERIPPSPKKTGLDKTDRGGKRDGHVFLLKGSSPTSNPIRHLITQDTTMGRSPLEVDLYTKDIQSRLDRVRDILKQNSRPREGRERRDSKASQRRDGGRGTDTVSGDPGPTTGPP